LEETWIDSNMVFREWWKGGELKGVMADNAFNQQFCK